MKDSHSESYRAAGVDVTAGYRAVELMREHVQATFTEGVIGSIGGFGGMFQPNLTGISTPVLVSGTDGVGTKLKLAFIMDKHDTVGIDCVAMCVNDVACANAAPLIFLDYIACGKNHPEKIAEIVKGISNGCRQAGCALVGGETAEMPGFYPTDEYDLAGFTVGLADKDKITDPSRIAVGDALVAFPSTGVHSNGFSLVRRVFHPTIEKMDMYSDELGCSLGEALLMPTKIYVKPLLAAMKTGAVTGASHITGGGFYENIPRMLPENLRARVEKNAVNTPVIFNMISSVGHIPEHDMYNTFNMGAGMIISVRPDAVDAVISAARAADETLRPFVIGEVMSGERGLDIL